MFYLFISAESPNDDDDPLLPESKYSCDECEYSTSVQANLTTHKKRKQMNVMMYPCDFCIFSPLTMTQLRDHTLKYHKIPCEHCAFIATTHNKILFHIRRYHNNSVTLEKFYKRKHDVL